MIWMEQLENMESSEEVANGEKSLVNSYYDSSIDQETSNDTDYLELLYTDDNVRLENEEIWFDLVKRNLKSYETVLELCNIGLDMSDAYNIIDKRFKKLISIGKKQFNMTDDFINSVINVPMKNMDISNNTEEIQSSKKL